MIMTMSTTTINVAEAKAHLSEYLAGLKPGDRIVLCKRNKPIAQVLPIEPEEPRKPVVCGLAAGQFKLSDSFFEPLPEDMLRAFYGEDPDDILIKCLTKPVKPA